MEANTQNYNRIFQYTIIGAVLFILTIVFIVSNLSNVARLDATYSSIALLLGTSSIALLYKAIKEDNPQMRSM